MSAPDSALPLQPIEQLALAYAPAAVREATRAVLALDRRLGEIVGRTREPMLAQIKLAWWRERLTEPRSAWPAGEPLLEHLRGFADDRGDLTRVVDGWEALIGEPPLAAEAIEAAAVGRAHGFVFLAALAGMPEPEAVLSAARQWAAADLALHVTDRRERELAAALARFRSPSAALPRALRPLAVLRGAAMRRLDRGDHGELTRGDIVAAMRLGLLGR